MAKKNPKTKTQIMEKLQTVLDPEMNISIVDLGLVYKIICRGRRSATRTVKITMTLTSIGCPLFPMIENEIKSKIKELGYLEKNINIELSFDPPWSMDKLTKKGKAMLGI